MMLKETHFVENYLDSWANGKLTLREIKGYLEEELYAISRVGYFLIMQGKNQEARVLFEGLVAIDPRNDYYYRALGLIFQKLGEDQKALRQYSYAIRIQPQSPYAFVNRAEIYLSLRDFNKAEDDLREALEKITPKDTQLAQKASALLSFVESLEF